MHLNPTPTSPEVVADEEISSLLNSKVDPWSFSVDRLRKILNFAIRPSTGEYTHIRFTILLPAIFGHIKYPECRHYFLVKDV